MHKLLAIKLDKKTNKNYQKRAGPTARPSGWTSTGNSGLFFRETDGNGGSLANCAFDVDLPLVHIGDVLDDGQA